MTQLDRHYDNLIRKIFLKGVQDGDRTGTGTRKIAGEQIRFSVDLDNFPIVTEKRIVWNSLWTELVWLIQGRTNVDFLHEHDVHIWDEWADESGDVGPVYGKQWRDWNGTDQLQQVVDGLRENPTSRRHLVSAWNVDDIPKMGLPPCHFSFQFISQPKEWTGRRKLHVVVNQRSCDVGLGVPFNWTSYATLLALVSQITDHEPGDVIWNGGDVHIYDNHTEQLQRVLQELEGTYAPELQIDPNVETLDDISHDSVELVGYEHGPFVKMPVAS